MPGSTCGLGRGFTVEAYETEQVEITEPGNYVLPGGTVLAGEQVSEHASDRCKPGRVLG